MATWSDPSSWKVSELNGSPGTASTGSAYVSFSYNKVFFYNPFSLILTQLGNPVAGTIKYTLDRSDPRSSTTAITYTGPISISSTVQVQVAVLVSGSWGPILSRTYLFSEANIGFQFSSNNLPLVIVETFGVTVNDKTDKDAFVVVCEPTPNITTVSDDCITIATPAIMHLRGSSSAGLWPKFQYSIKFFSPSGKKSDFKVLGLPKESTWVLQGTWGFDKCMLRNPFTYHIYRENFGHYAPRVEYTEVLLNQNYSKYHVSTTYWGLYMVVEKPKRDSARIDIADMTIYDNAGEDVTGGYIFKIDRKSSLPPYDDFATNAGTFIYDTPDVTEITTQQKTYLTNYINAFYTQLMATKDPNQLVSSWMSYIELNNTIDYHILTLLSKNLDGLVLSTYLTKPRSGPFYWGPPWDYDLAWGTPYNRWASPAPTIYSNDTLQHTNYNLWTTMFDDRQFVRRYVGRYHMHRKNWLNATYFQQVIDYYNSIVLPVENKELTRWAAMYSIEKSFLNFQTRKQEIDWFKDWVYWRIKFMDERTCYGVTPPCADNNYCTDDVCSPKTAGLCFNVPKECPFPECKLTTNNGGPCDDKNLCTINDVCSQGNCSGVFKDCSDQFACTLDVCDGTSGNCVHTPRNNMCDDGIPCTNDYCDVNLGCVHEPRDNMCDDGIACSQDICVVGVGCQSTPVDSQCDDGVKCTQNTCVLNTGCVYTPRNESCDDSIPCTIDVCDATLDCQYVPVDSECNDNVDCTTDTCVVGTGCVFSPVDTRCNDNIDCTVDVCTSTGCKFNPVNLLCDDRIECTVDTCSPTLGCQQTFNHDVCQDGVECTENLCTVRGCTNNLRNEMCVDNITCTIDLCTLDGCKFTPNNISCGSKSCFSTWCNDTWPEQLDPFVTGIISGCGEAKIDGCSVDALEALTSDVSGLPMYGWIAIGVGVIGVIAIIAIIVSILKAKSTLEIV
eukprot:TRINITY_DN8152_c0_g1_i1.p1 TRINITY_DN8152_c0_g1~~TRINITY_DN8152_c0_g1_i1.p1  ORF type:complete len:1117 (-),score=185.43 TRINITY_DN8152_c0_g1_i1:14-2866(-)